MHIQLCINHLIVPCNDHKTINKPEAVAKNKAIQGAQLAGGACVVEDTSLEFSALGGMPGKLDNMPLCTRRLKS